MGTRDIYIAIFIMIVFSICVDFLFNEESQFCCLPASFTGYHIEKLENMTPTPEEIEKAKKILDQVGEPTVPPNPLGGTHGVQQSIGPTPPGGNQGSPQPPPSGGK